LRTKALIALLLIGAASLYAAGADPTRKEAGLFQQKLEAIRREQPKRRTVVVQAEIDSYFRFDAAKDLPVGIVNPTLVGVGPNRVSASAVVDLDAVRKASPPQSLLDPKNLLIGRVPLSAVATFTSSNGMGKFVIESAKIGTLPLPKLLLDEVASYYTRSVSRPNGYTTEDPFPLPAGIKEIHVTRGQALVVQ